MQWNRKCYRSIPPPFLSVLLFVFLCGWKKQVTPDFHHSSIFNCTLSQSRHKSHNALLVIQRFKWTLASQTELLYIACSVHPHNVLQSHRYTVMSNRKTQRGGVVKEVELTNESRHNLYMRLHPTLPSHCMATVRRDKIVVCAVRVSVALSETTNKPNPLHPLWGATTSSSPDGTFLEIEIIILFSDWWTPHDHPVGILR